MPNHDPPVDVVDINANTKVSDILDEYGDIAEVMETFGIKRVRGNKLRRLIARAITVQRAAKIHRVPLEEFLVTLRTAVGRTTTDRSAADGLQE
jgi:hypothetical protein